MTSRRRWRSWPTAKGWDAAAGRQRRRAGADEETGRRRRGVRRLPEHDEAEERDGEGPDAIAITVDSGVAEVVRKQEAGWSYLKSGS